MQQRVRVGNFRHGESEKVRLKGRQSNRNANEGADGSERRRRAREREREASSATSAARFNYTLQTHDMSKSYTSYRLRHLLKVSSRAPCRSVSTPSFCCAPKEYSKDARNIRTKSSPKEEYGGCEGWQSPGRLAGSFLLRSIRNFDSLRAPILRFVKRCFAFIF